MTPKEMCKMLRDCGETAIFCVECPSYEQCQKIDGNLLPEAARMIEQLVKVNKAVMADTARMKKERNAALEKETPKPCEHNATLYKDLTCPKCGNVVSEHEQWGETHYRILSEYCKFCGQHLAWPLEEENGGKEHE